MTVHSKIAFLTDDGSVVEILENSTDLNLFEEDIEYGFCDYYIFEVYNSLEDYKKGKSEDGGQVLLRDYYEALFGSDESVIEHLLDTGFVCSNGYEILKGE